MVSWFKVRFWPLMVWVWCGILLAACGSGPSAPNAPAFNRQVEQAGLDPAAEAFLNSPKPKLVTTTTILADMVQVVAGDQFVVYSILQPGVDPHVYEATPGDSRVIAQSDMVFANGLNLEPKLLKVVAATDQKDRKSVV